MHHADVATGEPQPVSYALDLEREARSLYTSAFEASGARFRFPVSLIEYLRVRSATTVPSASGIEAAGDVQVRGIRLSNILFPLCKHHTMRM